MAQKKVSGKLSPIHFLSCDHLNYYQILAIVEFQ